MGLGGKANAQVVPEVSQGIYGGNRVISWYAALTASVRSSSNRLYLLAGLRYRADGLGSGTA